MSVREQWYWSTRSSMMEVWPFNAASNTGVLPFCTHRKRGNKDYTRRGRSFRSYPLTACSMLVTHTTQPTHIRGLVHLARYLHTGHHDTKRALSAANTKSTTYTCTYEIQACYSGPTTCVIPPTSTSFTTCTTCHMCVLSSHNPQWLQTMYFTEHLRVHL